MIEEDDELFEGAPELQAGEPEPDYGQVDPRYVSLDGGEVVMTYLRVKLLDEHNHVAVGFADCKWPAHLDADAKHDAWFLVMKLARAMQKRNWLSGREAQMSAEVSRANNALKKINKSSKKELAEAEAALSRLREEFRSLTDRRVDASKKVQRIQGMLELKLKAPQTSRTSTITTSTTTTSARPTHRQPSSASTSSSSSSSSSSSRARTQDPGRSPEGVAPPVVHETLTAYARAHPITLGLAILCITSKLLLAGRHWDQSEWIPDIPLLSPGDVELHRSLSTLYFLLGFASLFFVILRDKK